MLKWKGIAKLLLLALVMFSVGIFLGSAFSPPKTLYLFAEYIVILFCILVFTIGFMMVVPWFFEGWENSETTLPENATEEEINTFLENYSKRKNK